MGELEEKRDGDVSVEFRSTVHERGMKEVLIGKLKCSSLID